LELFDFGHNLTTAVFARDRRASSLGNFISRNVIPGIAGRADNLHGILKQPLADR
jgi:hypothetical protein